MVKVVYTRWFMVASVRSTTIVLALPDFSQSLSSILFNTHLVLTLLYDSLNLVVNGFHL